MKIIYKVGVCQIISIKEVACKASPISLKLGNNIKRMLK